MKTKDLSWHRASLEFLDRSRVLHSMRTPMDDRSILLSAVEKWQAFKKKPRLSPTRFEKTHGLEHLPDSIERGRLTSTLNIGPLMTQPKGNRFRGQLESLLPADTDMLSTDPIVRKAMVYSLGRLVCPLPTNRVDWTDYPKGLDYLTSALLTVQELERVTGGSTDWLAELNKTKREQANTPQWEVLTLRPDGPISAEWTGLINRFRTNLRSLRFMPLRQVCECLKDRPAGKMGGGLVERECGESRRKAQDTWSSLQSLLTERFVPSLPLLGLHYRIRFTRLFKRFHPLGSLCEILELATEGMAGLRFHVEPVDSEGQLEPSDFEITADQQVLSMRMDFYSTEKDSWELGVFEESEEQPESTPGWLYMETNPEGGVNLTEKERHILSILWTHRGARSQREILLETMGVPRNRSTMNRLLSKMQLTPLHHPSLESVGLPDGTVVAVRDADRSDIEELTLWLTRSFPYVRLYRDLSAGSLLAVLRLPEHRGNFFSFMIGSKLTQRELDHITTTVKRQRTFYMTTLSRLRNTPS